MNELEYEFSELPLIVELGFEAALINGVATIGYQLDGEWSVREIALDGYRPIPPEQQEADRADFVQRLFQRKPVALCRDSNPWLYATIIDRLESGAFKSAIEEAVAAALADEGIILVDPNIEHRISA